MHYLYGHGLFLIPFEGILEAVRPFHLSHFKGEVGRESFWRAKVGLERWCRHMG